MSSSTPARAPSLFSTLRSFIGSIRDIGGLFAALPIDWSSLLQRRATPREDDPETRDLFRRAGEARAEGRREEAAVLYRAVRARRADHVGALRGLRDLAAESSRWPEALDAEETLVDVVPAAERRSEHEWLAAFHYEQGRADLMAGRLAAAIGHFRQAVRVDRDFVPASLALGDTASARRHYERFVRMWKDADAQFRPERDAAAAALASLKRGDVEQVRAIPR